MENIKLKKCFSLFSIIFIIIALFAFANKSNNKIIQTNSQSADKVLLGGDSIGLSIGSHVEIVGFNTEEDGLVKGDIIISINDKLVKNIEDVHNIVNEINENYVTLKILRNNKYEYFTRKLIINEDNSKSLGLFVRDKILGIGTMTFVNLETKKFASLGHGVENAYNNGDIYTSRVQSIKKATSGVAGEKIALINDEKIGNIKVNNNMGVFGNMNKIEAGEIITISKASNIKTGKAKILTVVSGDKKEYFDIEILEVRLDTKDHIKGIKYKVTDERLLNVSGGIVCGMSGSPIIQNNTLVGAVSHVSIDKPSIGYGVIAEYMYKFTL